jgi:hypothetical protein
MQAGQRRYLDENQKETTMLKKTFVLGAIAALAMGSAIFFTQPAAAADGCGPDVAKPN